MSKSKKGVTIADEVVEILRSGNFTIAYHDNNDAYLYKGKHKYDDLPESEFYSFSANYEGYTPEVVFLLVMALKGRTVTA